MVVLAMAGQRRYSARPAEPIRRQSDNWHLPRLGRVILLGGAAFFGLVATPHLSFQMFIHFPTKRAICTLGQFGKLCYLGIHTAFSGRFVS